jgi:hypothetical protein
MQSQAAVTIRGLVMFVTLVAVPGLALFCKSVPTLIDQGLTEFQSRFGFSLLDGVWKTNPASNSETAALPWGEAPPFEPSPASATATTAVAEPMPGPPANRNPPASLPTSSPAAPPAGDVARAVSYDAPLAKAGLPAAPPAASTSEPGRIEPGQVEPLSPHADGNRFAQIQARLREVGASYYLLESWGTEQTLFRFHCRMPLAGGDGHFRTFESTQSDPLAAMEAVLTQVEQWRASRAR